MHGTIMSIISGEIIGPRNGMSAQKSGGPSLLTASWAKDKAADHGV